MQVVTRLFILGMGHVLGISPSVPQDLYSHDAGLSMGGDFAAVGNDLRLVMRKYPPTPETAKKLGVATQLELAGIK